MLTPQQQEFLDSFVLGNTAAVASAPRGDPGPLWEDAVQRAQDGVGNLARTLRKQDDPQYAALVSSGLMEIGKREQGELARALAAYAAGKADAVAAQKAVRKTAKWLGTARILKLIDENPFGVQVGLRATLARALRDIDKQLAAA